MTSLRLTHAYGPIAADRIPIPYVPQGSDVLAHIKHHPASLCTFPAELEPKSTRFNNQRLTETTLAYLLEVSRLSGQLLNFLAS